VEVRLGKPALVGVSEAAMGAAWVLPESSTPGVPAVGDDEEEWIEIAVEVELEPRPDRTWLSLWYDIANEWPEHLSQPLLDCSVLFFSVAEDELEHAWGAVKQRVGRTNVLYAEETWTPEGEGRAGAGGIGVLRAVARGSAETDRRT
jgi:hypothetical protein